jgi:phosphopantetheinyl transferase
LFSLFSPPDDGAPTETLHATCRLRFGTRRPPQKPSLLVVQHGLGDCAVDMTPFWDLHITVGRSGMFRNMRSISSLTTEAVSGEVIAGAPGEFGRGMLTGNPIRLDGLFYMSSLPDVLLTRNASHYVQSIASITFFDSDDPNEARFCRASNVELPERSFVNCIEGIGSLGTVLERIEGAVSIRAGNPPEPTPDPPIVQALKWNPQRTEVARLLGLRGPLSLTEVRVSLVGAALAEQGDERFLASWLSEDERERLCGIGHARRRREWLAARVAGKEAIRSLLGAAAPAAAGVAILNAPDGAPQVSIHNATAVPNVSLAHSDDSACAAAVQDGRVGIDVEKTTLAVEQIAERFCKPDELELIMPLVEGLRVPALMVAWVAKEAALKVVGAAEHTMGDLEVRQTRAEGRYTMCDMHCAGVGAVRAVAFHSHHYFYAVASRSST